MGMRVVMSAGVDVGVRVAVGRMRMGVVRGERVGKRRLQLVWVAAVGGVGVGGVRGRMRA